VLGRGARPEQVGVARLVVALPVADPAAPDLVDTVPDDLAHEPGVRALVAGRRGRQEVGRLAGPPRRARAQRDPQFLVAVELAGRAEQAIADAAHHAQPDAPWFG